MPCKTDPRASHGFLRNESHSADKYICECVYWEPEISAFDGWYNGTVGVHINSERILDDLDVHYSDAAIVERWMKVCWNQAIIAAQAVCKDEGTRYPWEEARAAIDSLKEKT